MPNLPPQTRGIVKKIVTEGQARPDSPSHMRLTAATRRSTERSSIGPVTEGRYRAVFESVRDAILLVDRTGRYIDANPAATELLGYERREFLSMRISDVVAAQREWSEAEFRRFREQERWTGEIDLRRKDGSLARVEASATRIEGESGPVYVSVLRDVADRQRAQEERAELLVREQEARSQAEAALQQVRLVSDVSQLLAVSLDYPATFHRLAETMAREIADLCLIDMVGEAGVITRGAAVHATQSKQGLADRLAEGYPPRPKGSDPIALTLSTGGRQSELTTLASTRSATTLPKCCREACCLPTFQRSPGWISPRATSPWGRGTRLGATSTTFSTVAMEVGQLSLATSAARDRRQPRSWGSCGTRCEPSLASNARRVSCWRS